MKPVVVVRGAGDLATAVGRRLHLCGFSVVHLETPAPTAIRLAVSFAAAVFEGSVAVEGVEARLARNPSEALALLEQGFVAVLVDPELESLPALSPALFVDASMLKGRRRPPVPTRRTLAPRVVALGPGFTAGEEAHAVVETQRGHDLGRVLWEGHASPYTGVPGEVGGAGAERVLRAPCGGIFEPLSAIGDSVGPCAPVARVGTAELFPAIPGVLRGLLHRGIEVREGQKVGDVDPRGERRLCFTVSDKANAVAGGVLEAAFCGIFPPQRHQDTKKEPREKGGGSYA